MMILLQIVIITLLVVVLGIQLGYLPKGGEPTYSHVPQVAHLPIQVYQEDPVAAMPQVVAQIVPPLVLTPTVTPLRSRAEVHASVKAAFEEAGLPMEQFDDAFNLASTGKVQEIITHAEKGLGANPSLRTVGDVITHLCQ
jgi:hypothetical protein